MFSGLPPSAGVLLSHKSPKKPKKRPQETNATSPSAVGRSEKGRMGSAGPPVAINSRETPQSHIKRTYSAGSDVLTTAVVPKFSGVSREVSSPQSIKTRTQSDEHPRVASPNSKQPLPEQEKIDLSLLLTEDPINNALFLDFVSTWHERRPQAIHGLESGEFVAIRGSVWQLVSRSVELLQENPNLYQNLLKKKGDPNYINCITMDLPRTPPYLEDNSERHKVLFNVLYAYSVSDSAILYCQGMSYVVSLLISVMPEENAFWMFCRLMKGYCLERLYSSHEKNLIVDCGTCFSKVLRSYFPRLHHHLEVTLGYSSVYYISSWFPSCFLFSERQELSFRLLDIIVTRGIEAYFRVALAILDLGQEVLLKSTFDGCAQFFRELKHECLDVEEIIQTAIGYPPDFLLVRDEGLSTSSSSSSSSSIRVPSQHPKIASDTDIDAYLKNASCSLQ